MIDYSKRMELLINGSNFSSEYKSHILELFASVANKKEFYDTVKKQWKKGVSRKKGTTKNCHTNKVESMVCGE